MGGPHVDDICSTIGNVARIAAVVELSEAVAACEAAEQRPLELVLLNPQRKPESARENLQNRKILEAFIQFRWHIEAIQRECDTESDIHIADSDDSLPLKEHGRSNPR